jgi:hypothetical protein
MRILKYKIPVESESEVMMPEGAIIRHFGQQGGGLFIWAEVDVSKPIVVHKFRLYGTGREITGDPSDVYIGTTTGHLGTYVWHLFEVME